MVFPGSPGTPAYPAYVLTYKTALQKDPYRHLAHVQTVTFGDRCDAHNFSRYRQFRSHTEAALHSQAITTLKHVEPARNAGLQVRFEDVLYTYICSMNST